MHRAHRLSWLFATGDLAENVLHHCDVRACVNPAHLFAGTTADNNRDMAAKGRARNTTRRGEYNSLAKLTEQMVREIRVLLEERRSQTSIARIYGVNHKTISNIATGKTWTHV